MRVCYFGTYRPNYSRNQIMIEGLRRAGVDVIECHTALWSGVEDRVQAASGGWVKPSFMLRVIKAYWSLLRQHRSIGEYDLMIVGYPGQFDVYLARLLAGSRHKPLVWDIFMSIYLIALERSLDQRSRFTINLLRRVERRACCLPDHLIIDTIEYVDWFQRKHGVKPDRFDLVPTGADDRVFQPIESFREDPQPFTLIYYGTFIANHGVPMIIEAARLLKDDFSIRFVLIGRGPEKDSCVALVEEYQLQNVIFLDWVEREDLPKHVAEADVCLGVFGKTTQSLMTIQNKIYEALAMQRPLITGDSVTVRAAFQSGEQLLIISRDDPNDLVKAIKKLQADRVLRKRLGAEGYAAYAKSFTTLALGQVFRSHLERLLLERKP